MKKRLLITSALMTAVLGASLATGTYAWYSATASLSIDATQKGSVGTATSGSFEDVSLSAAWTVTTPTIALTDNKGDSYLRSEVSNSLTSVNPTIPTFTQVTLVVSGTESTDWAAFADDYVITVTPSSRARLSVTNEDKDVYEATAGATITFDVVVNQYGIGTSALTNATKSNSVTLVFYVSINGEDGGTSDTGSVNVELVASIAAK